MAGFSFRYSRKNPRDVSAAFRLFIASAQFAFRFHRSKQRVCFVGGPDYSRAVNVTRSDAFWPVS
jgi:hypothetical protein